MELLMTKILLEMSEDEDKIVEVYKIVNGMRTKQDAIKEMVRYFKVSIKPKNLDKKEDYYKKAVKF